MLATIFWVSFGSRASSLIFSSSSGAIVSSVKSSSTGTSWFASMNKSNLVLCPPVRRNIGISFTMPVTCTLLPGFVLFSVSGETKSFRSRTFILFGCAPPSICSGTSSSTIIWASHSSLLSRLNFPLRPQLHLVGS